MSRIQPTDEQSEAIEAIQAWHRAFQGWSKAAWFVAPHQAPMLDIPGSPSIEFLLDGGAGTGKSTTAGLAVEALGLRRVVFGAYTAKAARVMQAKGMEGAATLHSLLYRPEVDSDGRITGWTRRPDSPCRNAELIVVDEVSMCPESIARDLRSYEKPILALGDVDGQLPPPEGAGAFQRRRPDFRLHELHRAAAESPITRLAWQVRRGSSLLPMNTPECFVGPLNADDAWEQILDTSNQVICGKHKTREAVIRRARERFGFSGPPHPGELLICTRNDPRQSLVNGDIFTLWQITKDDLTEDWYKATILLEGEEHEHVRLWRRPPADDDRRRFQAAQVDFAYAITAHKAQGSEFPSVVVIDDQFARWDKDLRRRWLYTSLTRASNKLQVFTTG